MLYIILGVLLVVAAGAIAWLVYQNRELRTALAQREDQAQAQDPAEELRHERAIRRNLQRICDRRGAELRRIKENIQEYTDRIQTLENALTQKDVEMFEESGRRILAEKDESARRMKLELAEKQLDDLHKKLKARDAQAKETEARLQKTIDDLKKALERVQQGRAHRAGRKAAAQDTADSQISVDEILKRGPQ